MRSFKEYWNEHGDVYAMDVAENAWDYQQSKIDELQNRINEVLEDLEHPTAPWVETIASVIEVLRGDNA